MTSARGAAQHDDERGGHVQLRGASSLTEYLWAVNDVDEKRRATPALGEARRRWSKAGSHEVERAAITTCRPLERTSQIATGHLPSPDILLPLNHNRGHFPLVRNIRVR